MLSHHATSAALQTISRPITTAAGLFAPGHLGELTRIIDFDLADAALQATGTREHRLRSLPSRVGLYFVLALAMFPHRGYQRVWDSLTAALQSAWVPTAKALRDVRRRLGPAPLKHVFDLLAGPVATPVTPGARFAGYRTVSFDGCRSIRAPDSGVNQAWLGKQNARHGTTGYPVLQLMTLVETGTRALIGAAFGTPAEGELTWARKLLGHLDGTMLVLADRGFDAAGFLTELASTQAQFLVRIKGGRRLPVLDQLPDGSVLSVIGAVKIRIITAQVQVTCHDGTVYGDQYRLATTLTDHRAYPADALVGLYHERWEHEVTYLALRHTILAGRVLRSRDPAGVEQEMWALLGVYQALRIAAADAASTQPGIDPDRIDFTLALSTAQDLITTASNVIDTGGDLLGQIGKAVLGRLMPPRRPRVCPRRVKSPLSRWNKHPPDRPHASHQITEITITATDDTTHRPRSLTPAADP